MIDNQARMRIYFTIWPIALAIIIQMWVSDLRSFRVNASGHRNRRRDPSSDRTARNISPAPSATSTSSSSSTMKWRYKKTPGFQDAIPPSKPMQSRPTSSSSTSSMQWRPKKDQPSQPVASTSKNLPSNTTQSLSFPDTRRSADTEFCESEPCKYFAQSFLSNLDWNSYYCDDFYGFVTRNNQFKQSNPLKAPDSFSAFARLQVEHNIETLCDMPESSTESANLARLRNFKASFYADGIDIHDFLVELIRILGGFPLAGAKSGWNEQVPFDWLETTANFRLAGLNLDQMFNFGLKNDGKHYRLKIAITEQDKLANTMIAGDIIKAIYLPGEMANTLEQTRFLSWMLDVDDIFDQFEELNEFRSDLREIIRSPKGNVEKVNLDVLEKEIPEVNWSKLLQSITNLNIESFGSSPILIDDMNKVISVARLLSKLDPRVLANHMMLSVIDFFGPYAKSSGPNASNLSKYYKPVDFKQVLMKNLGLAISVEYWIKFMDQNNIDLANLIISGIKNEIKLLIDEADWIAIKLQAKYRIDTLKYDVGLPDRLRDPTTSNWFYKGLKLDPENIFDNLMQINSVKHRTYISYLINENTENFHWIDHDLELINKAELKYDQASHTIHIPIGLLDQGYVNELGLPSINFAVFGTKIAHEMILAMGLQGMMQSYSTGTRSESGMQLLEKLRCLRNQYNGLWAEGSLWLVDGDATLMKNMADNAGVEVAYRAFLRNFEAQSQPSLLRGVPLDSLQLFWASYAVSQHRNLGNRQQIDVYRYGPESLPKYRVNIPLGNHESFSKDFKCPRNTVMNPVHRCTIWS